MLIRRVVKVGSAVALAAGLFALGAADELAAAGKKDEAKKYHEQLKTATDPKKKVEALTELGNLGRLETTLAEPAVPDMLAALKDRNAGVRKAAAEAVGKVGPDPKAAVPPLVELLKTDKDEGVKLSAVRGLAAMHGNAKDALPALREARKGLEKQSRLGRAIGDAVKAISGGKK